LNCSSLFSAEKLIVVENFFLGPMSKEKETILQFLKESKGINPYIKNQLSRASISMVINIAEGSGKFSKAEKRNFYTISRGSVYECVSLLELILEENQITKETFQDFYQKFETISKMLLGLINSQK